MKKTYVIRQEQINLGCQSFESAIKQMTVFKEKHPTGTDFKFDMDYEYNYFLVCTELETDKEFVERCEIMKGISNELDDKVRKELERLRNNLKWKTNSHEKVK